ncbi:DUF6159 family protein [uncultured Paraglaciecola sp.]|uniref:DUF6159 family protein n=1 Tax=uncultured Paraglaciecola sp. TaxID=1765024 RepID=UPI0030D79593|tara:strand:+ start:5922 stop:6836 length:915 start_codon:yes stop_codon:yes gene_type:complete
MFREFKRSLAIFKSCFAVFKNNPKLLIFQFFNMLPVLTIWGFFLVPLLSRQTTRNISSNGDWSISYTGNGIIENVIEILSGISLITYIAIYLFMMFVTTFIHVAFYSELLKSINGQPVSISHGFQTANRKIKAILLWSLLSGLVGVVIRILEGQFDFIGRWIMGLVGFAWSVVTVFSIPVLIREKNQSNPINYLKYSAKLIKKTWGEGVIGFLAITVFSRLLILALFITPIVVGFFILLAGFKVGLLVMTLGVFVAFLLSFIVIYFQSLMTNIFRCTLYVYASEGVVPTPFCEDVLIDSFKQKE